MYAYTSKGPFLLEQAEWYKISEYGVQVLLKGRVTPDADERTEIVGDIEILRRKRSWYYRMKSGTPALLWRLGEGVFLIVLSLIIGRWIRGTW
jgi:hypothetical protein